MVPASAQFEESVNIRFDRAQQEEMRERGVSSTRIAPRRGCGRRLPFDLDGGIPMKIRRRAFLLSLLPVLYLLGPQAVVSAAPSPTPDVRPGDYLGTVTMTVMHEGSTSTLGGSTSWSIDMVESIGDINISFRPIGTWFISVDMPVPIDGHSSATISDKASKCKGYDVTSSGYGRATGKTLSMVPHAAPGVFYLDRMDFALSSLSARIRTTGQCPSETWGQETREAIDSDFTNTFGSKWTFTAITTKAASLAGTCESATFGKGKGQILQCGWRAYLIPSK
jgi:hypothetical protein